MTIMIPDTGVADLIFVYSAREAVLRRLPELEAGASVASDRPRLTLTSPMGRAVLEKGLGGWAVTSPSSASVRLVTDPGQAAESLLAFVGAASLEPHTAG